jgi:hypothetical protein
MRVTRGEVRENLEPRTGCRQSADDPSPTPADVRDELLSLWSGEHRAHRESVRELVIGDPTFTLDKFLVHDGDLPCRATEGTRRDPRAGPQKSD